MEQDSFQRLLTLNDKSEALSFYFQRNLVRSEIILFHPVNPV